MAAGVADILDELGKYNQNPLHTLNACICIAKKQLTKSHTIVNRRHKDVAAFYRWLSNIRPSVEGFKQTLENYITERENLIKAKNKDHKANDYRLPFFGKLTGFNAELKINAATKMKNLLSGVPTMFSNIELEALRDSTLGKIISQYEQLELLPQSFILQENAKQEKARFIEEFRRYVR